MDKKTYTITEAMPIFGVSRTTVTYWISVGIIDAEKVKGKWIIDGQSVKDWQEFQALGFPAANSVMRKRFEMALEKNKELMKIQI
ncbi:helix-turn-helix domain-containing protein [Planococcus shixiaomingii]|uniref:helix-turn-helix domain-containing protein n=1 Tax=Planococcus shixiaomingii TaxID=3058393 RepID=UPI00262CC05C|nr:helix-turn-helix domain-containing protein [Planococcus sp. N022]WKA56810.1 helix-turn-helix domain-containing protein [Planococcus sp. N022]